MRMGISPSAVKNSITERCLTGLEYMPWLKGGPNRWKWTEIILKSDKLIVNVVVLKLCNCIWDYLKCKGEINRRHYLLTDPRIRYSRILTWNIQYWFKIMNWKRLKNKKIKNRILRCNTQYWFKVINWKRQKKINNIVSLDGTHNPDLKSWIENGAKHQYHCKLRWNTQPWFKILNWKRWSKLRWNTQLWFKIMIWKRLKNFNTIVTWDGTHKPDVKSWIEETRKIFKHRINRRWN